MGDKKPVRGIALVASQVLAADAASVTFSSIPQTFKHLRLVASARGVVASTNDDVAIRINGDATAAYYRQRFDAQSTNIFANDPTAATANPAVARVIAASLNANSWSPIVVDFPNYSMARWQQYLAYSALVDSNTANSRIHLGTAQRTVAEAITSITLLALAGNLKAGSTFSLYGLAA